MPSKSARQHRFMEAIAHNPSFARKAGVPQSVGQDFAAADRGRFALGGMAQGGFSPASSPTTRAALYGLEYGDRYQPNIISGKLPVPAAVPPGVPSGSVIAGLAPDNSLTQLQSLNAAMRTGPYGTARAEGGHAPQSLGRMSYRDGKDNGFHAGGFIDSDVPGRTDRLPMSVAADSFVFPADTVSAAGQGNSAAGARLLDGILGVPERARASSGSIQKSDVIVAGGEYTATPGQLSGIGRKLRKAGKSRAKTDLAAGHEWARKFVEELRKHQKRFLKHAPKPKR